MSEMKMLTTPCVCTSCIYKLAPDTFKHPEKCLLDSDCLSGNCINCRCYPIRCKYFKELKMEMSDRPTTSVIESLKKIVEEEAQKHTYHFSSGTKFNVSDMYPLKQIEKYPTTRETRKYLISRIRWNMLNKDITTQQYRSLKGEIRRGNIIGPVHSIRKFVSGQECLRETLDFMMRKKHLGVGKYL